METKNINKAIKGLEDYFSAISAMSMEEFDYCYNLLLSNNLKHFKIEMYLRSLKKLEV